MKKIVQLTLFLAIVAALSTGLLAGVNLLTKDKIAQQQAGAETAAFEELYPEATSITAITDFEADANGLVTAAYKIDDTAYAFKVSSQGYKEPIEFIIGFDADGSNSKYKVTAVNDTKDLGTKVGDKEYTDQMTGLSTTDTYPLISGATVSSTAVTKGVAAAVEVFNSITGQTGGPVVEEPEVKQIVLSEVDVMDAEVVEVNPEGQVDENPNVVTYKVKSPGYHVIEGGEANAYNFFYIKIDGETRTIVSVEFATFNDTEYIGDKVDDPAYFEKYVGLSLDDQEFAVDTVTGATYTAESLARAVQAAIDNFLVD